MCPYAARLVLVFFVLTAVAFGQGGPPLLTDDPGTPGNRNWEINFASMLGAIHQERYVEAPLVDVNYGLGNRIQLKYQGSYIWDSDGIGGYRSAMSNSVVGVKWRFYQQNRKGGWNVSTYPQLEVNNPGNSYGRGLVELGPRFLLPIEVATKCGPVDVNFEGGYRFNRRSPNQRILGLAFGHQFARRFEGLAEVYDDVILGGTRRSTTFDFGGRYEFHNGVLLLFMMGRSFGEFSGHTSGQPDFIGYFGLQVQLNHGPRKKHPNSSTTSALPASPQPLEDRVRQALEE